MLLSRVSPLHPTVPQLLRWGANFGPFTLGGQWWRLITSLFLHIGIVHLAVNMWCLWHLGIMAEEVWKRSSFATLYLIAGAAGALASLAWHPFVVEAGASGAIFGVAGALIVYFLVPVRAPDSRLTSRSGILRSRSGKLALGSLLAFAAYNLVFGMLTPGIANAAHIGGFVAGLLLGLLLIGQKDRRQRGLALAVLALVIAGAVTVHFRRYAVHVERGERALSAGNPGAAIAELTTAVRQNPQFAQSYLLLGQAYLGTSQFAQAEAAFRHALALEPDSSQTRSQLGMSLALQGRTEEAKDVLLELVRHEPNNPQALLSLGVTARMSGNYETALALFRRAAQLAPNPVQADYERGSTAMKLQRYDEAIAAFARCVRLEPGNYDARLKLAEAYKAKGMETEAQAAYDAARKLVPQKDANRD
jgi:rhomboid protease GluP